MIKQIKKIKNLGIFADWSCPTDLTFNRYNLFYGWNGSGKSTLSKLFSSLEKQANHHHFQNLEFKIELDNGFEADEKYKITPSNIKVFNNDFIKENVLFEKGTTGSIIYIGKENTELKREIDALRKYNEEAIAQKDLFNDNYKNFTKTKDSFFTNTGTILRTFFVQTVFAGINYDKRSSEKIWEEVKKGASLNDFVFSDGALESRRQFIAQGQSKKNIEIDIELLNDDDGQELYKDIISLLEQNPVIVTIERLKKNTDISDWVQKGLEIHHKHNSLSCEFCNQPLLDGKINNIEQHFSEEFVNLQKDINNKINELKNKFIPELKVNIDLFYSDLFSSADYHINLIIEQSRLYNHGLQSYINLLELKAKNPLNTSFNSSNTISGLIGKYNSGVKMFKSLIDQHNSIVSDFSSISVNNRIEIEKHFVAVEAINQSFTNLLGKIVITERDLIEIKEVALSTSKLIKEKEELLQNEHLAISEVNNNLHRFLGRNEITLEKNVAGGYVILRNDVIALNLSEGEKTAIALIYFIVKLKEKDNEIQNTIIVFDDPISSLDSNHLFNAFSFITTNCTEAKQLIILSHNFWFFKLIRDWMLNKNKNRRDKPPVSSFFEIKKGNIQNADKTLLDYNSEYHYVFKKMLQYSISENITFDESFVIANTARRVLESFGTIKNPHSSSIMSILCIANEYNIEKDITDKIYYFLNKYSHLDRIENHENTLENIAGESKQVVSDILNIIKTLDNAHFSSMEKLCELEFHKE